MRISYVVCMEVNQVFLKVRGLNPEDSYEAVRGSDTYLLESVGQSMKMARYSFIGFNPAAKLTIKDDYTLKINDPTYMPKVTGTNPFEILESTVTSHELVGPRLSRFCGGYVGYLSYDVVSDYVNLQNPVNDLNQPFAEYILSKNNIIFDHQTGETYLVENHFVKGADIDAETSIRKLEEIHQKILEHKTEKLSLNVEVGSQSNTTQQQYENSVTKAKEYVKNGDAFQIVLSQRLQKECVGDKFQAYKKLMQINPSPYMYYLDFGVRQIVGSSPETLARVEQSTVSTYPIAGTRPRGKTEDEDRANEVDLLHDEKELAEHLMLIDLGRNDVGKVSKYGSVHVKKMMEIERFSHVMHISSEVEGTLAKGQTEYDALKSIFPAGTVSGAPKVRAMEIIDELEQARRGIYAGCVGYFSFSQAMDTAITIRTIVFEGDTAYIQAGAGIVADSNPNREYEETLSKAKVLMKVLEVEK